MTDCLFCKIAAGEIPADKIYEDDHLMVFKDIAPKAEVHWLAIPKQHIVNLFDANDSHQGLLGEIMLRLPKLAKEYGLEGFRTITNTGAAAGQEVFHIHFHVIPRNNGTSLGLHGRSKAKTEHLETIAEKIRAALD